MFFRDALNNNQHYDNIFIYSDQQAGHGGLYGYQRNEYATYSCVYSEKYIDVYKLFKTYKNKINNNAFMFSVQTAGYDNGLIPDYADNAVMLYGWTGKEALFAKMVREQYENANKGWQ